MRPNKVIGLTGTIASGKSTAAAFFRDECGFFCIDADKVGHEVLEEATVKQALTEAFGTDICRKDGTVDRKALGNLVFADPAKREKLNTITHPVITEHIRQQTEASDAPIVLIEAYGLLESGLKDLVDEIWVVGCDRKTRAHRIVERSRKNGGPEITLEEAKERIASQWPDEQYREVADIYLDGSGSEDFLKSQCRIVEARLHA